MIWNDWSHFFAMGGYGLYVWGSIGMCLLVPLIEVTQLSLRRRALRTQAAQSGEGAEP